MVTSPPATQGQRLAEQHPTFEHQASTNFCDQRFQLFCADAGCNPDSDDFGGGSTEGQERKIVARGYNTMISNEWFQAFFSAYAR
jgi:hypothetical protein